MFVMCNILISVQSAFAWNVSNDYLKNIGVAICFLTRT
jgi:hypothetical protein